MGNVLSEEKKRQGPQWNFVVVFSPFLSTARRQPISLYLQQLWRHPLSVALALGLYRMRLA